MDKNEFLKEIRHHSTEKDIFTFIEKEGGFETDEQFFIDLVNVCPSFLYLVRDEDLTINVVASALSRTCDNIFDDSESLSKHFNSMQKRLIDISLCRESIKEYFSRELYLKCKDSILIDSGKVHRYLEIFLPELTENDGFEIYNICITDDIDLGNYTKSWILVKLAEHKLITKEQLAHIVSTGILKYQRLDTYSRSLVASEALAFSPYNFKYLSEENRVLHEKNINFKDEPMLTGYIVNKSILSPLQWVGIIESDQRAMRFLPSYVLSNHSVMSDGFLLRMIKKQNRYRHYAKIVPFINQISPERLSLNFCQMLKDNELTEYNHPVIQDIVKSQGIGVPKVYKVRIKKNIFKLNQQQLMNLKSQINAQLN